MAGTWKKIIDSGFKINNKPLGESNSLSLTKGDLGLGKVDNKSEAEIIAAMKGSLVLDDLPDITITKIKGLQTALDGKVPTTRKINGKLLNADITVSKGDLELGNVENKSSATIRSEIVEADIPKNMGRDKIVNLATDLTTITSDISDILAYPINGKKMRDGASIILDTTDIIRVETTLPSIGRPGEMVRMGQFLYVWQDEV